MAPKVDMGRVWGSILEGFGMLQGVSWLLLGVPWALCAPSKRHFFKALVQHGLQDAFGIDFGSIWGGFGRDLGGIWEGFWRDLHHFEQIGGRFWTPLVKHSPVGADSLIGSPALTRSASRYAGVPLLRG